MTGGALADCEKVSGPRRVETNHVPLSCESNTLRLVTPSFGGCRASAMGRLLQLIATCCECESPGCARILFGRDAACSPLSWTHSRAARGTEARGVRSPTRRRPAGAGPGAPGGPHRKRPNGSGHTQPSRRAVSVERWAVGRSVNSRFVDAVRGTVAVDRTRVTAGSVLYGGPYPMRTAREALVVVALAPEGAGTRPSRAWPAARSTSPEAPEPGPTGPPVMWTRCRVHQGALVGRSSGSGSTGSGDGRRER
jgi:hypothetical protein